MACKNLTIARKSTKVYELIITKDDIAEDITGWTFYFYCKKNLKDTDANAKIKKKVITHAAPLTGKALIELESSDTDIEEGNYYYSFDYKDNEGNQGILYSGRLTIEKTVIQNRD